LGNLVFQIRRDRLSIAVLELHGIAPVLRYGDPTILRIRACAGAGATPRAGAIDLGLVVAAARFAQKAEAALLRRNEDLGDLIGERLVRERVLVRKRDRAIAAWIDLRLVVAAHGALLRVLVLTGDGESERQECPGHEPHSI